LFPHENLHEARIKPFISGWKYVFLLINLFRRQSASWKYPEWGL